MAWCHGAAAGNVLFTQEQAWNIGQFYQYNYCFGTTVFPKDVDADGFMTRPTVSAETNFYVELPMIRYGTMRVDTIHSYTPTRNNYDEYLDGPGYWNSNVSLKMPATCFFDTTFSYYKGTVNVAATGYCVFGSTTYIDNAKSWSDSSTFEIYDESKELLTKYDIWQAWQSNTPLGAAASISRVTIYNIGHVSNTLFIGSYLTSFGGRRIIIDNEDLDFTNCKIYAQGTFQYGTYARGQDDGAQFVRQELYWNGSELVLADKALGGTNKIANSCVESNRNTYCYDWRIDNCDIHMGYYHGSGNSNASLHIDTISYRNVTGEININLRESLSCYASTNVSGFSTTAWLELQIWEDYGSTKKVDFNFINHLPITRTEQLSFYLGDINGTKVADYSYHSFKIINCTFEDIAMIIWMRPAATGTPQTSSDLVGGVPVICRPYEIVLQNIHFDPEDPEQAAYWNMHNGVPVFLYEFGPTGDASRDLEQYGIPTNRFKDSNGESMQSIKTIGGHPLASDIVEAVDYTPLFGSIVGGPDLHNSSEYYEYTELPGDFTPGAPCLKG